MDVNSTLLTVASIFLLLMVGYAAKRCGILKAGDSAVVNSLAINLTMPAFIFVYTHEHTLTSDMVKAPAALFVGEMLIMVLAYMVARAMKLDRRTTGALMLAAAFGNTGFLGYPVTSAAFHNNDHAVLTAVMTDQFGMMLPLCTVGVAVATCFAGSKFEWGSLISFLKTPLFPTTVIALLLKNVHIPQVIMGTLGYLAAGTVPLVMISIGLSLNTAPVRQYPLPILTAVVLKVALLPIIVALLLPLVGVDGVVRKVAILEGAMPSAILAGVIAARYGANGAFAAGTIFLTTLASVLTIPGVLMLLR